jgi:hypothetical protein
MLKRYAGKAITSILLLILILIGFQNCDIKQPKVESLTAMSVVFKHSPTLVSCQSCHENIRPTMVGSLIHPTKSVPAIYTLNGSDPGDCIKCHLGAQDSGSWKTLSIVGDYHASATSCGSCHDSGGMADRTSAFLPPGSPAPSSTFISLLGGGHPGANLLQGKDCVTCHTAPMTTTRTTLVDDWLRDLKLSTGVHGGVTSCQECHKAPNQFDRVPFLATASPTVSPFFPGGHVALSNYECATCHTPGTKSTDWKSSVYLKLATFHSGTNECISCHSEGTKKDRTLFFKAGPSAATSVGTGTLQTFTLTNKGGHPSPTLMNQHGASDCKSCHAFQSNSSFGATPSSWAWNEFSLMTSFHLNSNFPSLGNWNGTGTPNTSANSAATGRCATCHGPGQAFDRTIIVKANHTGGAPGSIIQDCTFCHAPGNQVSEWVGKSSFVHPSTLAGAGNKYCFECHAAPTSIKLPPNPATKEGFVADRRKVAGHLGAEYASASYDCATCHTIPSATVSGWTQTDASGNVTAFPHKQINWSTGTVSNAVTCKMCHDTSKQAIKVYKTEAGQRVYKGDILVSSLGLNTTESTTLNTRIGHYTNGYGSDCAGCHAIPTTVQTWTATHPSVTGDCNQCHVKAPTTLVSRTGTHPTLAAGATCVGCHGTSTMNWADGKAMDHSGTRACTECHNFSGTTYTSPSGKVTGQKTISFPVTYNIPLNESHTHDTTTNCNACHTTPSPTASTFTNTWKTFTHPQFNATNVTDVSCRSCHDQAISNNVKSDASRGSHKHSAFQNGQCGMCHLPVSNAAWTPQRSQAHSAYQGSATYSCSYCHD